MRKNDLSNFGTYLKDMRAKYNISQETLAMHCGVSASSIAKFERGLGKPKEETRDKVLRGLKALTGDDPFEREFEDEVLDEWLYYKEEIDELAKKLNPRGLEKVRSIMFDMVDIYKYTE